MSKTPTLYPIRDRILVVPVDTDASAHGPRRIITTTTPPDKMKRGAVVAVGEGFLSQTGETVPLSVEVGEVVLFDENAGKRAWSFGTEYVILREQEVLAIEKGQVQE
jgi:chaperonin GroES